MNWELDTVFEKPAMRGSQVAGGKNAEFRSQVLGVRRCMRKPGDGCFQKQNLSLWQSGDFKIFHLECVSERVHPESNLELERVIWEPVCKPNDWSVWYILAGGRWEGS